MTPAAMARTHAAAFTQSRHWTAEEFERLLESPGCFYVGDDRAFALVRVIADEAELLTLATHPDFQRQGYAAGLMKAWQAEAQKRGAARGFLEVAADNAPARALYERCGYEITGIRRTYFARPDGKAVDALLMSRALTAGQPDDSPAKPPKSG